MRDERIAMIYEGTNHIQALDLVGRKLPMGGGELVRVFAGKVGEVLRAEPRVKAYAIFVAEPRAAAWLAEELPLGRGFAVQDVARLPAIMKEVFAHAAALDAT